MHCADIKVGLEFVLHFVLKPQTKLLLAAVAVFSLPLSPCLAHLPIRTFHRVTVASGITAVKLVAEIERDFLKLFVRGCLKQISLT